MLNGWGNYFIFVVFRAVYYIFIIYHITEAKMSLYTYIHIKTELKLVDNFK